MTLLKALPLVLVGGLVGGLAVADAPRRPRVDVTGDYTSNYDEVSLVQEGRRVRGTYVCCGGGTIEGTLIEGRVIRYHWAQDGAEGEGVWTVTASGRLEGTWGSGSSVDDGGEWTLEPKQQARIAN